MNLFETVMALEEAKKPITDEEIKNKAKMLVKNANIDYEKIDCEIEKTIRRWFEET